MKTYTCPKRDNIGTAASAIIPIGNTIYWSLDKDYLPGEMSLDEILATIEKAFAIWQPHFVPKFEQTDNPDLTAIKIFFRINGDPDLPQPFDVGVLGYAYYPYGTSLDIHSDMYINDDINWQAVHDDYGFNLYKVIVHELGHSFGLNHSKIREDIMYPSYEPNNEVNISEDTIKGIHSLYGVPRYNNAWLCQLLDFLKDRFCKYELD